MILQESKLSSVRKNIYLLDEAMEKEIAAEEIKEEKEQNEGIHLMLVENMAGVKDESYCNEKEGDTEETDLSELYEHEQAFDSYDIGK